MSTSKELIDLIKLKLEEMHDSINHWSQFSEAYQIVNQERKQVERSESVINLLEK